MSEQREEPEERGLPSSPSSRTTPDPAAAEEYDFFVAHAGADQAVAEELFRLLEPASRPFVDSRCLLLGDDWDVELLRAQQRSAVTVILITANSNNAFYQREEIATAISYAREDPDSHRVVPILLVGVDGRPPPVPYGLRLKHGIRLAAGTPLQEAADALLDLRRRLREREGRSVEVTGATTTVSARAAVPPSRPAIWNVPASNPNFTGRDELIDTLKTAWRADDHGTVHVQALHGLGGVGKSQLVVEYAQRHGSDYSLVWWVPSQVPAMIPGGLALLAARLGIPAGATEEQTAEAVREELSRRGNWLLVFDHVERPDQLQPYRPTGAVGHVLVTSRNPAWGAIGTPVPVSVLARPDSVKFLLRRTHRGQEEEGSATQLAEELGDLPLALEQAAAYVEETGISLADYLEQFRQRREDFVGVGTVPGYEGRLDTTWRMALDHVAKSPGTTELLETCAFLASDAIPLDLFRSGPGLLPPELAELVSDRLRLDRAVGLLRSYSLVDRTERGLGMHRLVQLVVRSSLTSEAQQGVVENVISLLSAAMPSRPHRPEARARCQKIVPHALAAADHAEAYGAALGPTARLLTLVGIFLASHVKLEPAEGMLERAIRIGVRASGEDDPEVAWTMGVLGDVRREMGELGSAGELLRRSLAIQERAFGEGHGEPVRTLQRLAIVERRSGNLEDARAHLERARQALDRTDAATDEQLATVLTNLGVVARDLGQLEDARQSLERAVRLDEKTYGAEDAEVATPLSLLGVVLRDLGQLDEARLALQRALDLDEAVYESNHPRVAARLNNLAGVLRNQGDLAAALAHYQRALEIDEEYYGPDHPEVATVLSNMGIVLRRSGELRPARTSLERALEIDSKVYRPDHPRIGTRLHNLGTVLRDAGEARPAHQHLRRSLAIFSAAYGSDHPQTRLVQRKLTRLDQGFRLRRRPGRASAPPGVSDQTSNRPPHA